MQPFKMSDTWKGYYEYGPSYSKSLRGKRVEFFLNLKDNNDEFSGECIDISDDYKNNLKAEVSGFVSGNLISFIKKYPYHFASGENGKRNINPPKSHPELEYTGYYDEASGKFTGEWLMVMKSVITKHDYSAVIPYNNKYFDQERYGMKLKEYSGLGTWEIEKVELEADI